MGLSVRAYAKARGVSHVAVLKAAKAGRIPLEPNGAVDPAFPEIIPAIGNRF